MGTQKNPVFGYSKEPYVAGTQKNRLSETIFLSTHNIGFALLIREIVGKIAEYPSLIAMVSFIFAAGFDNVPDGLLGYNNFMRSCFAIHLKSTYYYRCASVKLSALI